MIGLIERIERAGGPDRALNADILRRLGWTQDGSDAFDPDGNRVLSIPDYLGSLDAAMTLVPRGWIAEIRRYFNNDGEYVAAWKPTPEELARLNAGESLFVSVMSDCDPTGRPIVFPMFVGTEEETKAVVSDCGGVW